MLKALITYFNTLLDTSGYFDKIYPLCEIVIRDAVSFPAAWHEDGSDYERVTDFDQNLGTSYWRLSGPITSASVDSSIRSKSMLEKTYPLVLIVCVKRSIVPTVSNTAYTHDKLASAIQKVLKDNGVAAKRELGVSRVGIQFGSIVHSINEVQEAELPGVERRIPSDYVLLRMEVTVTTLQNSSCIDAFNDELSAPTTLVATSSATGVALTWVDNSSAETGFEVWRSSSSPTTGFELLYTTAADATSYTDTSGTVDLGYFYKVRATTGSVTSAYSNTAYGVKYSAACADATATLYGSTLATIASGASEAITVADQNANDLEDYVSTGVVNDVTVQIYDTASIYKTGQTTSYVSGDDGDREDGRGVDWDTLDHNNPFGNTNRFTDELGGQTYTNDIVIDWSTWVQSTNVVLGVYRADIGKAEWEAANTNAAAHTVGSYTTGWFLPNANIMRNWINHELSEAWNYSPLNWTTNAWTSTTRADLTTSAYSILANRQHLTSTGKTISMTVYPVRFFTWNGSALT